MRFKVQNGVLEVLQSVAWSRLIFTRPLVKRHKPGIKWKRLHKDTRRRLMTRARTVEVERGLRRSPTFTDARALVEKSPPPALRQRRIIRRLLAACLLLIGSVKQHERGEGSPTSSRAIDPITEFEEPIVADGIPTERLQPRSCSEPRWLII